MALAFDQLCTLVGNRPGVSDSACPLCSSRVSARGRVRRVMRVWREHDNFASFHCARCGEKGWARGQVVGSSTSDRVVGILRDAQAQVAERAESIRKARWLWSTSIPVTPETPVFTYLREIRGYDGWIPATLRYLRPRNPKHHHAMVAAIGMAQEHEPGVYKIAHDSLVAVQLTLL